MQVFRGAGPFINGMGTVWIFHKLKGLIVLDQLIEQHFGIVVMHIVISASMDIQQVSLQIGLA